MWARSPSCRPPRRWRTSSAVRKDPETLTLTLTAEFGATPARVWDLWADPRKLERWWGPPTYLATVTTHDLTAGGRVEYHMTGPDGDQPRGYWGVVDVDPPRRLSYVDGFAHADGTPNDDFPRNEGVVTIEPIEAGRTRMSIETRFPSAEALEQVLAMGMEEGLTQAVGPDRCHPCRRSCRMTMATAPTTHTLEVPGATLTYDVRTTDSPAPVLLLIGSPMGAGGFGTLASHFPDRTVATYDPRGVERSEKVDPSSPSTPEQHADDLHRLVGALGSGPIDLFASSGGAVNALAFVAAHPEQVRTLVAHEPPLASIVPDREGALAVCQAVSDTYQRSGFGAGMAHFITVVSHTGPMTMEFAQRPAPNPAMFGMPANDDGSRTDPLLGQNILTSTAYEPDFDALRAASTRIVVGVGAESEGELARRGGEAAAQRLGTEPVIFPSGHGGFLGNEYGQPGDPAGFAAKLREVLGPS